MFLSANSQYTYMLNYDGGLANFAKQCSLYFMPFERKNIIVNVFNYDIQKYSESSQRRIS